MRTISWRFLKLFHVLQKKLYFAHFGVPPLVIHRTQEFSPFLPFAWSLWLKVRSFHMHGLWNKGYLIFISARNDIYALWLQLDKLFTGSLHTLIPFWRKFELNMPVDVFSKFNSNHDHICISLQRKCLYLPYAMETNDENIEILWDNYLFCR